MNPKVRYQSHHIKKDKPIMSEDIINLKGTRYDIQSRRLSYLYNIMDTTIPRDMTLQDS